MPDENDEQVQVTKAELEALQQAKAKLEEVEPEFEKLKSKDMNFEKLREAKEKEGSKAKEKETEIEKIKRETEEWKQAQIDELQKAREEQFAETKDIFLKNLVGEDTKARERLLYEMDQLKGEVRTEAQLREKMEKAYLLINSTRPEPSAFSKVALTSPVGATEKKNFTDTTEGLEVLNKVTRGKVDWSKLPKRTGGSYFN